jgi:hypothetical protein
MNSAANAHASRRKTQLITISQAAVTLADFIVRSQSARTTVSDALHEFWHATGRINRMLSAAPFDKLAA